MEPKELHCLVYNVVVNELLISSVTHFERIRMPRTILKLKVVLDRIKSLLSKFVCR